MKQLEINESCLNVIKSSENIKIGFNESSEAKEEDGLERIVNFNNTGNEKIAQSV